MMDAGSPVSGVPEAQALPLSEKSRGMIHLSTAICTFEFAASDSLKQREKCYLNLYGLNPDDTGYYEHEFIRFIGMIKIMIYSQRNTYHEYFS